MKKVEIVPIMLARNSQSKIHRRKSKSYNRPLLIGIIVAVFVGVILISSFLGGSNPTTNKVLLRTSMGDIIIEVYDDMPITTGNFKNLVQQGVYKDTIFHRVAVNPPVIQAGDASVKGISVPTILDELPNKHSNVRGSVAMAKTSQKNSATSQFYINLKDNLYLDANYTVFGRVIEGMGTVDDIGGVETEGEKPLQDIKILRTEFVDYSSAQTLVQASNNALLRPKILSYDVSKGLRCKSRLPYSLVY